MCKFSRQTDGCKICFCVHLLIHVTAAEILVATAKSDVTLSLRKQGLRLSQENYLSGSALRGRTSKTITIDYFNAQQTPRKRTDITTKQKQLPGINLLRAKKVLLRRGSNREPLDCDGGSYFILNIRRVHP